MGLEVKENQAMKILLEKLSELEICSVIIFKDSQGEYVLRSVRNGHFSNQCRYSLRDLTAFRDNLTMLIEHELKEGK